MDNKTQIPPSGTAVPPSGTVVPPSGTAVPPSGTAVPPSGTAVPPSGTAVPPSGTAVPPSGASAQTNEVSYSFTTITIGGITYTNEALIYDQSGEARLYRVEAGGRRYALKLYNRHRHPNHEVLEIVKQMPPNPLVIALYDHGSWEAPDGYSYDFELMKLCKGKSLATLRPLRLETNGEKRLKEIARRMAAAIDFCHSNKVLHRDIKPANFLYEEENGEAFVLTDFGIGKKIGADGRAIVDIGRTPIYAAPETYTNVPGVERYATTAADFYSMGITLMVIWMGEDVFRAKSEADLFHDKQRAALPYPSDKEMSRQTLALLKSLTRPLEEDRAKYEDIEKWAQGEDVFGVEKAKFEVSFTSGLTAYSPEELARMMWDNKELAKRYLYKEQIEKMLRETHYPELAQSMSEITEDLYPGDKDAGLYAACLALDKDMGYTGLEGNPIKTAKEMARELLQNESTYLMLLAKPTHYVWVYLQSMGAENLAKKYPAIISKNKVHGLRQLCYELDNGLPFYAEVGGRELEIDNVEKLCDELKAGTFCGADYVGALIQTNASPYHIAQLANDDFLTWLAGKNPALGGAAMQIVKGARQGITARDLGWRVAYTVAADRGYDFLPLTGPGKSSLGTIVEIADRMAVEINSGQVGDGTIVAQMDHDKFMHSRLYQYLTARKKYDKHISWINYCMDINSADNQRKSGPYNRQIAQMKAVTGLTGRPFPLVVGSQTLLSLSDYEKNQQAVNANASGPKAALLQNWLTLHFQENPKSSQGGGNYTVRTAQYTYHLMTHLPFSSPAKRANATQASIEAAKADFNSAIGKVKFFKILAIVMGYIPLTLACLYIIYNLIFNIGSDDFSGLMDNIGNVLGWIVGIIGGLACCSGGIIAGIIGGVVLYWLTVWLVGLITPLVPWLLVAVLLFVMLVFWTKVFGSSKYTLKDTWSTMDLSEATSHAIVGDAFGTRDKLLPGLPADYPACVYTTSASSVKEGYRSYVLSVVAMIGIAVGVMLLFVWGTSQLHKQNDASQTATMTYPDLTGTYDGIFDGRQATMTLQGGANGVVEGTIVIQYRKQLMQQVHGGFMKGNTEQLTLEVMDANGQSNNNQVYEGTIGMFDSGIMEYSGVYTNKSKGSQIQFVFTQR